MKNKSYEFRMPSGRMNEYLFQSAEHRCWKEESERNRIRLKRKRK